EAEPATQLEQRHGPERTLGRFGRLPAYLRHRQELVWLAGRVEHEVPAAVVSWRVLFPRAGDPRLARGVRAVSHHSFFGCARSSRSWSRASLALSSSRSAASSDSARSGACSVAPPRLTGVKSASSAPHDSRPTTTSHSRPARSVNRFIAAAPLRRVATQRSVEPPSTETRAHAARNCRPVERRTRADRSVPAAPAGRARPAHGRDTDREARRARHRPGAAPD